MPTSCSICKDFSNINSIGHRMSKRHQKNLSKKLRQTVLHVTQKKATAVKVHDDQWSHKDYNRFCHFCVNTYLEHKVEEELTVESLGSIYHHASEKHANAVKSFLKLHGRTENYEKFCINSDEIESFLKNVQEAKTKYLKKMQILHQQGVSQIKQADKQRQDLHKEILQSSFTAAAAAGSQVDPLQKRMRECERIYFKDKSSKIEEKAKVPPWLMKEEPNEGSVQLQVPVIGPTADTFFKHVANLKKKGLSSGRIGANFERTRQLYSTWLPSYQGIWSRGSRKKNRIQFKRRH